MGPPVGTVCGNGLLTIEPQNSVSPDAGNEIQAK